MAHQPSGKKIFDVAKPGKSAPTSSSRPLIVGHGPMVKDPTIATPNEPSVSVITVQNADDTHQAAQSPEPLVKKRIIKPITDQDEQVPESATAVDDEVTKDIEVVTDQTFTETASDVERLESSQNQSQPEPVRTAEVNETAEDPVEAKNTELNKLDQSQADAIAKAEAINKLIEEKQYVLPVGEGRHGHGSHVKEIFLLILIVGLVAAYLSVDAGLVDVGLRVPIDMIKNLGE